MTTALVVVDVQRAFDDLDHWSPTGRRDNPQCEENVGRLIEAWRSRGEPVVFVRHDSEEPDSPLAPGGPGNAFKDVVTGEPDLLVTKTVNSAFLGTPDLAQWLRSAGAERIALCGIQTNHCVETTARMGANLGFDVLFVRDACHTFDRMGPDGEVVGAEDLVRATLTSLHDEFATIVRTEDVV
jgi:nicotinamidase-related amidase